MRQIDYAMLVKLYGNESDAKSPERRYNFCKIHRTLRVTPAMAAGVVTRRTDISDLVAMLEESEKKRRSLLESGRES